jgi:hypothetical protein
MRSAYRISVRKHEGKALLVRHRYRWEHDIKMVLKERGDRGSTVVKVLRYKSKVAGSIPDGVIGIFH